MNVLWIGALNRIIAVLVGSLNYERIRALVDRMECTQLTGIEKRNLVFAECQNIAVAIGTALLNLAIEAAVVALRNKK